MLQITIQNINQNHNTVTSLALKKKRWTSMQLSVMMAVI